MLEPNNPRSILRDIGPSASGALPALTILLQDSSSYSLPNWQPWMRMSTLPNPPRLTHDRNTKYYYQVAFPEEQEILTRSKAIDAIGRIGISSPGAIDSLSQLAKQDKNRLVRLKATWATIVLGGDEKANLPFLEETLKSSDSDFNYVARNILEAIGKPAGNILIGHYLRKLDNPEERTNAVLWLGNNRLGAVSLEAVPKIRPYLAGNDLTLRGYTVTILANIADSIIQDARNNQLSDRQLKSAIEEYTKVNEITQKPNTKFNAQPVERLQNSLNWLKRYQTIRSGR